MPIVRTTLAHWGFDYVRLRFGLRTGLAACLALLAAWALGLEHPQWSAMTVWAVSQPTRGLLVEKAAYRGLGTLLGTLFGMLLVVAAGYNVLWLVIGLSLWLTLCVYAGNLLHGLIAYGTILAGYSASMVVLLTPSSDALIPLGIDRLLTVLIGIMVSLVVGFLMTYKRAEQSLINQLRRQTAANLQALSNTFADPIKYPMQLDDKLTDLATLESQLLEHGTGSVSAHESAKTIRHVLNTQLGLLCEIHSRGVTPNTKVSEYLHLASVKINESAKRFEIIDALTAALNAVEDGPVKTRLRTFVTATQDRLSFRDTGKTANSTLFSRTILHRDWQGAQHAASRTLVIMLLIGGLWWYTGWFQIAYLLLGASVMLTLFSTADNPALAMKYVFLGQAAGAVIAVLIQGLVWNNLDSVFTMLVALMPIILLAGFPLSHRTTAKSAMDFNLVFLLLMQPSVAYSFHLTHSISIALAVVVAPLIALLAYRLIYPTNLGVRYLALLQRTAAEVTELKGKPLTTSQYRRREARLYHRIFKLTQLNGELGIKDKDALIAQLNEGLQQIPPDRTVENASTR